MLRSFVRERLDPGERVGEVLFGLIMVLTITLAAKLAIRKEGAEAVEGLLIAAVGCNFAWGIIDGAMYLMARLLERSRSVRLLNAVQSAPDEAAALKAIQGLLEDTAIGSGTDEEQREIYRKAYPILKRAKPERIRLNGEDFKGSIACFLLVVISTLPAVLPFLIFREPFRALRVSNGLLLVMLFLTGYEWGKHAGLSRWVSGTTFLLFGGVLVIIAVALGG